MLRVADVGSAEARPGPQGLAHPVQAQPAGAQGPATLALCCLNSPHPFHRMSVMGALSCIGILDACIRQSTDAEAA